MSPEQAQGRQRDEQLERVRQQKRDEEWFEKVQMKEKIGDLEQRLESVGAELEFAVARMGNLESEMSQLKAHFGL